MKGVANKYVRVVHVLKRLKLKLCVRHSLHTEDIPHIHSLNSAPIDLNS